MVLSPNETKKKAEGREGGREEGLDEDKGILVSFFFFSFLIRLSEWVLVVGMHAHKRRERSTYNKYYVDYIDHLIKLHVGNGIKPPHPFSFLSAPFPIDPRLSPSPPHCGTSQSNFIHTQTDTYIMGQSSSSSIIRKR